MLILVELITRDTGVTWASHYMPEDKCQQHKRPENITRYKGEQSTATGQTLLPDVMRLQNVIRPWRLPEGAGKSVCGAGTSGVLS